MVPSLRRGAERVHRRPRWLAVSLGLATAAAAALAAASGSAAVGTDTGVPAGAELPDLQALAPSDLRVAKGAFGGRSRWLLAFSSATINTGDGPLTITGSRPSKDQATMTATQVIATADGTDATHGPVGKLRYVPDETHSHWHLLGFMRYEVRRVGGSIVRRDKKEGFCLGDRFAVGGDEAAQPGNPVYAFTDCGRNEPATLTVSEGISVGYGDNYEPFRDGQFVDVTGLPAGRYLLIHRTNPTGAVLELNTENNASSALFQLAWPRRRSKRPMVTVLATCPHSDTCTAAAAARR